MVQSISQVISLKFIKFVIDNTRIIVYNYAKVQKRGELLLCKIVKYM